MLIDIDLHNETVSSSLEIFEIALNRHNAFILITGYGKSTGKSKIKNAIKEKLEELKRESKVKAYFIGSTLNIFNNDYLKLKEKQKELIRPYIDKLNEGMILVVK